MAFEVGVVNMTVVFPSILEIGSNLTTNVDSNLKTIGELNLQIEESNSSAPIGKSNLTTIEGLNLTTS